MKLSDFFINLSVSSASSTTALTPSTHYDPMAIQDGFEIGMVKEMRGLWIGDEKYKNNNVMLNFCSQAIFNPQNDKNFLTWNSVFASEDDGSCKKMGVDVLSGGVNNAAWYSIFDANESYILQVQQKKCLSTNECDYDVLSSGDFDDFQVMARGCGTHLKKDLINNDVYSCEVFQVNLLENSKGEEKVVVIFTYSSYENGHMNYRCPERPTFNEEEVFRDIVADGMAQFVLQSEFQGDSLYDPASWECLSIED